MKQLNSGSGVHGSAPPLATEVASLIKKVTLALRSHIREFTVQGYHFPYARLLKFGMKDLVLPKGLHFDLQNYEKSIVKVNCKG